MKIIEEKLSELDNYFSNKKETEKWGIILGVAGLIAYIAFTVFLPFAEEKFNSTESTKKELSISILDHNNYLKSITKGGDKEYYLKKYDRDLSKKNKELGFIRKEVFDIDSSLSKLSDMLFNEKSWSIFLNSLTNNATENGLEVTYIKNKYVDNNGSFGHILEIELGCEGSYKSIVKFMNSVEQNKLVTDIYGSNLTLEENSTLISADLNISVWGINHWKNIY